MVTKRIVWRWKADIEKYIGKPGVVGVRPMVPFKDDDCLLGRDGYVGYIEDKEETSNMLQKTEA